MLKGLRGHADGSGIGHAVDAVMQRLSQREKLAQLVGLWVGAESAGKMAPLQDQLAADTQEFEEFAVAGLGQLCRPYGTKPMPTADGAGMLAGRQEWLRERGSAGIPALVHEECLTGVLAWGATVYPTPLAWGATFDPEIVQAMADRIGHDLRALGVHQGLAPVLDVIRDLRWGRVEECISEDPLVVGLVGEAYVRGLEGQGRVATPKHFVAYSGSRAGRNHAPVPVGPRELADTFLPPFERALRAGARSVMHSYADVDGVPPAASVELLTGILRERWGFAGTVVADYYGVTFLQTLHGVAASLPEAAALALQAGVDVELPTGAAYLRLGEMVDQGMVPTELIDRALRRVLRQKAEQGLLDEHWDPDIDPGVDLDCQQNRRLAREVARRSVVLVTNNDTLPLDPLTTTRVAVIGPNAQRSEAMLGCYSFINHTLPWYPGHPAGMTIATMADGVIAALPAAHVEVVPGCTVTGTDRSGFPAAVAAARRAELAVVVVGDSSGMFGRGTSGEGCDLGELRLPGVQRELVEAVAATGTPVVLVLLTGRPYPLEGLEERCAAVVQAFFPGCEGATAIGEVLVGTVNPSGRLPVGLPTPGAPQPSGYRTARLGQRSEVSSADPTAAFPFGHGLSYTTFSASLHLLTGEVSTDGDIGMQVTVRNTGERTGTELVQLYLTDPVAQVARPVRELAAFRRIELEPGEAQVWQVHVPAAALAYTGVDGRRRVEPGLVSLALARDAADPGQRVDVRVTGEVRYPARVAEAPRWVQL